MRKKNNLPDLAIRVQVYDEFRDEVKAFAEGKYQFLIVIGGPGSGKTTMIQEALGKCLMVSGTPTAWRFYQMLHDDRNLPVVMDDVNARFYGNDANIALLKNLTDMKEVKTLRWLTAKAGAEAAYPSSFETTSRVIIVTNLWDSVNEHVRAIEDRATIVSFEPSPTEVHREVGRAGWFRDQEVFDFIWQHIRFVTRPSMRLYRTIAEQKAAGRPWRKRGMEMLMGDERLVRLSELLTDPRYQSNLERLKAFEEQGYGKRTLFYKLLEEFAWYSDQPVEEVPPLLVLAG